MDAQKSNILFMFAKSPWSCLRDTGESIYNWIKRHVVMILIVLILGIVWKLGVLYAPKGILCFIWRNIRSGHEFCYAILSSLSTRTVREFNNPVIIDNNVMILDDCNHCSIHWTGLFLLGA